MAENCPGCTSPISRVCHRTLAVAEPRVCNRTMEGGAKSGSTKTAVSTGSTSIDAPMAAARVPGSPSGQRRGSHTCVGQPNARKGVSEAEASR